MVSWIFMDPIRDTQMNQVGSTKAGALDLISAINLRSTILEWMINYNSENILIEKLII